jgi:ubiquinone/menaquinone biosynthesis C-methylase UbiE
MTNVESWDRIAARTSGHAPAGEISYAPGGPTEDDLRLIGDVADKRILELGCGSGAAAVTFVQQGASVIAVDASSGQLERARALAEHEEARVEWHHGDLADLAFLRADSVDLAFSAFAIAEVEDLDRMFRQVHRVLRPGSWFIFSYEHPLAICIGKEPPTAPDSGPPRMVLLHSYFGDGPVTVQRDGEPINLYQRTVAAVFAALGRAGFGVETIVEPKPEKGELPASIVWRARKEGM